MSTMTAVGEGSVTQGSLIRAELIKFRSLRSTWFSLALMVILTVGLGWLFGFARAHEYHQDMHRIASGQTIGLAFPIIPDAATISLNGIMLAQLVIGVLGVLIVSSEYASRMILTTTSSTPRRLPVLFAKVAVFTVVVGIVAEIAMVFAFIVGQGRAEEHPSVRVGSSPGAARAVFGGGLYLICIGLLGVGLAFILRNTAGAISTLMALVLVLPLLAQALPHPWNNDVSKYLPLIAGTQIITTPYRDPAQLAPWAGLGVAALWALAALVLGGIVLRRRDA